MKVLIVCSGNKNIIKSFIKDQAESTIKFGITIDFYLIKGKGPLGYLRNLKPLKKKILEFHPDLIHAHYGLSGLLANFQRKIPVIVTYHGSDINAPITRWFSRIAIKLAAANIFVSKQLSEKAKVKNPIIIPCGVNLETFRPLDKMQARLKMNLDINKKYVLFPSSFNNYVKNYKLAKSAIDQLTEFNIELIELQKLSRIEVSYLLNAVDLALMTSFSEGSPQFIKEAMACNTPIVSVNVGETKKIINNAINCYITKNYNSKEIAYYVKKIIESGERSNGRVYTSEYNESIIAYKVLEIYKNLL